MAGLSWSDAAQAQLAGGAVRPAVFFRMDTADTPVRLWGGIGDFALPGSGPIEPVEDAVYHGFGELLDVPVVQQLMNGKADRVDFRLSGAFITPQIAQMASTEAHVIRDTRVNLGFLVLGRDLQPISPVAWVWSGLADVLSVEREAGQDGAAVRSLVLSVGSVFTGRRRAPIDYWTDPAQRRISPDDAFCKFVALYSQGTQIAWPK